MKGLFPLRPPQAPQTTPRKKGYWLAPANPGNGGVQIPLDGGYRLYQGDVFQWQDPENETYIYYQIPEGDPPEGQFFPDWKILQKIACQDGSWTIDDVPCTEEEASAAMAAYQPVELELSPLTDFPMGDDSTFGQILEAEGTPTEAQMLSAWADYVAQLEAEFTCFALEDINGDGVEDLLLSVDAEMIDLALAYRRGQALDLMGDFYLCRDNVLELYNRLETFSEGITEIYRYCTLEGNRWVFQDILRYNVSADTWRRNSQGNISQEEAQAVLDKYQRITPDFRPIGELTG